MITLDSLDLSTLYKLKSEVSFLKSLIRSEEAWDVSDISLQSSLRAKRKLRPMDHSFQALAAVSAFPSHHQP